MPDVSGSFCIFSGSPPATQAAAPHVTAPAAPELTIAASPPNSSANRGPTFSINSSMFTCQWLACSTAAITSGN